MAADILHEITIEAPPGTVYRLLSESDGLKRWWTPDVQADREDGGTVIVDFGSRMTLLNFRIKELAANRLVHWVCADGPDEWKNTELIFEILPEDGHTVLIFTHRGWQSIEGLLRRTNTDWGRLLYVLKNTAEGRSDSPFMG